MDYRALGGTGLQVSVIGYGASSLGGVFGDPDESTGMNAVHRSFDLGVNFVDVSPYYGLTVAETVLGKALKGVPRDSYVLATKVGRSGPDTFDFSAARVTRSVEESLTRLGVDHIDLDQIIHETIPALRDLATTGKVCFVGVTGYPLAGLDTVTAAVPVDTILTYCRYNLLYTSLGRWLPGFTQRGVGVVNASVLAMGALTNRGAPPLHPAPAGLLELCAQAAKLCDERGTDIAKLAMQFALARTDVASTLVGSADPANMERNIAWAHEPLDTELLADVEALRAPVRDVSWPTGRPENNNPDTDLGQGDNASYAKEQRAVRHCHQAAAGHAGPVSRAALGRVAVGGGHHHGVPHPQLYDLAARRPAVRLLRVRRGRPRRRPGAHGGRPRDTALVAVDRPLPGTAPRHAGGPAVDQNSRGLAPRLSVQPVGTEEESSKKNPEEP